MIEGVEACHLDAQPLTQATSDALGITVSRTALRLRNSANAPTGWQREQLQRFQSEIASDAPASEIFAIQQEVADTGESAWVYMSPIVTGGVCLNCHGDNLQPDLQTALATRYPDDQATGFALGELRGAFVAIIPAEVVSANIQAK